MSKKKEPKFKRDTEAMRAWLAGEFVSSPELIRELELWLTHFKQDAS